jgi:hypothetical protein
MFSVALPAGLTSAMLAPLTAASMTKSNPAVRGASELRGIPLQQKDLWHQ